MRTKFLAVIFGVFVAAGPYAQTRLAFPNDPAAGAGQGESEIIINAANVEQDIAVWVNDVIAAHVRPKTTEKIIVRDGRNIIHAAVTTARGGQWTIGDRKELLVNSASNRVTISLLTRYGRLISLKAEQTVALQAQGGGQPQGGGGAAQPQPQVRTPAPRPAASSSSTPGSSNIEDAVNRAAEALTGDLPEGETLAIISISSSDKEMAEFVIEEMAYLMVDTKKFKVVDRKSLDAIKSEQNFQYSGEVDDDSAVSIGKMLGASIVITGSVSGSGSTRRLRVKALNVRTAEIVAMVSERF